METIKTPPTKEGDNNLIDDKNKNFGSWETLKKFELMEKEWSMEGGELTPTMKVKRKVVNEKYKELIERIYSN